VVQSLPRKRQTLLFSATLSKEIEALTREFQNAPKVVQIGRRSNPAETVTQLVYEVPKHLKTQLLCHLLNDSSMNMVLVFTRTKHGADRVARRLDAFGIKTGTLHANRSQNQRLRALEDFRSGGIRVLIATDIAARGIDVDGISHVVNLDFPPQVEDYIHRIGRTGRANAIGDAISFICEDDHGSLRSLERFIGRGIVRKRAEGFDYNVPAPAPSPEESRRTRNPRDNRGRDHGPRGGQGGERRAGGGSKPAPGAFSGGPTAGGPRNRNRGR
jgi:ATP-dependent RNA helicase RhlE